MQLAKILQFQCDIFVQYLTMLVHDSQVRLNVACTLGLEVILIFKKIWNSEEISQNILHGIKLVAQACVHIILKH